MKSINQVQLLVRFWQIFTALLIVGFAFIIINIEIAKMLFPFFTAIIISLSLFTIIILSSVAFNELEKL